MSALELMDHFVIYHTARNNTNAMSFILESSELRHSLTIALCKIYWSDESKTLLKKYEDRLADIVTADPSKLFDYMRAEEPVLTELDVLLAEYELEFGTERYLSLTFISGELSQEDVMRQELCDEYIRNPAKKHLQKHMQWQLGKDMGL